MSLELRLRGESLVQAAEVGVEELEHPMHCLPYTPALTTGAGDVRNEPRGGHYGNTDLRCLGSP